MRCALLALLTTVALVNLHCSSDDEEPVDAGSSAADTGSAIEDAGAPPADSGAAAPDSGAAAPDSGAASPDSGSPAPDGGTSTCAELSACCEGLEDTQLQADCRMAAQTGDDQVCADELVSVLEAPGTCQVDRPDAGPDAGAMQGPLCQALGACCPSISDATIALQCTMTAGASNEASCDTVNQVLVQGGYCAADAGVPDAG